MILMLLFQLASIFSTSGENISQRTLPKKLLFQMLFTQIFVLAAAKWNSWFISMFLRIYLALFMLISLSRKFSLLVIVLPKCKIESTHGRELPHDCIFGSVRGESSQLMHLVFYFFGSRSVENFKPWLSANVSVIFSMD